MLVGGLSFASCGSRSKGGDAPSRLDSSMGFLKKAGAIGIGKAIYDQARKPQNQARMRQAAQSFKNRKNQGRPR